MDIQKKYVSVNMPVADFSASALVDSDAIVSDSKPDLLRIIQIDPSVRIVKSEVMNGKMMVSGHVSYKILYQPEESEGICSMSASGDFSHMEENPDFAYDMNADVTACVEHIEPEIINSRKIKIKSVITLDVSVTCSCPVNLPLEVTGDNIQVKYGEFGGFTKVLTKRDIITLSETLSLPAGKPNIGSLLKTDVSMCNKDVKVISGKVIIKGDLLVNSLYVPESAMSVDCCSHNIPFTEILDAEGLTEDHLCCVKTEIEECDFSLATDADGDVRVINAGIRIGVRINADSLVFEKVVTDAYSLTDKLDIGYSSLKLKKPVSSNKFDYTLKNSVHAGNVSSVFNVTVLPIVTLTEAREGSILIEGYSEISALCIIPDEICPVVAHYEEIPFKIETDLPGCLPGMDITAEIETSGIAHNLNASGDMDLRITLSCNVQALEKAEMDIVDRIESAGPAECRTPSIVLYFVQKDDTLWDIAKRYHTKQDYIRELNGDDCDSLKRGSQLLIPRG